MKIPILLATLFFSLTSNADSFLIKEGSENSVVVYSYVHNNEVIKTFNVPNFNGPRNKPSFAANCAINRVNMDSDEEGRFFYSERVDIYCGKNPAISVSGHTPTGLSKTNLFGFIVVESKDKSWAVLIPDNDSSVPGYVHLQSNGNVALVDLREHIVNAFFAYTNNSIINVNGSNITIEVTAKNTESTSSDIFIKSILTIFSDGTYKITH